MSTKLQQKFNEYKVASFGGEFMIGIHGQKVIYSSTQSRVDYIMNGWDSAPILHPRESHYKNLAYIRWLQQNLNNLD